MATLPRTGTILLVEDSPADPETLLDVISIRIGRGCLHSAATIEAQQVEHEGQDLTTTTPTGCSLVLLLLLSIQIRCVAY